MGRSKHSHVNVMKIGGGEEDKHPEWTDQCACDALNTEEERNACTAYVLKKAKPEKPEEAEEAEDLEKKFEEEERAEEGAAAPAGTQNRVQGPAIKNAPQGEQQLTPQGENPGEPVYEEDLGHAEQNPTADQLLGRIHADGNSPLLRGNAAGMAAIAAKLNALSPEANGPKSAAIAAKLNARSPGPNGQNAGARTPLSRSSSFSSTTSSSSASSSGSDRSSITGMSEASTTELLGGDPLFLVLSQFFMTNSGRSIADILDDISVSLRKLAKK